MSFTPSPTLRKVLDNVKPEELDLMLRQNYKHLFKSDLDKQKVVMEILEDIEKNGRATPIVGIDEAIANTRNQDFLG